MSIDTKYIVISYAEIRVKELNLFLDVHLKKVHAVLLVSIELLS